LVSAPAYQFGNSWASPFITKNAGSQIYRRNNVTGLNYAPSLGMYDTSYLTNSAVWDGYYFSSAAPIVSRRQLVGSVNNYAGDQDQINETYATSKVISDWIDDPATKPLRNSRYLLHMGNMSASELKTALADPKGARDISAHIMVDGAFNVNSTSVKAWESVLASLKGDNFAIEGMLTSGTYKSGDNTPFPRMRYPAGPVIQAGSTPGIGDKWNAFRELSDDQIRSLAEKIVDEVKSRGPFQSLGEFVNRRLASTDLGLSGAVQSAIDNAAINAKVAGATVTDLSPWGSLAANFKKPVDVSTATPGWLTQADVLTPLAPIITVRSDTFTVRAYGEAQDDKHNVTARSWCEATVQRMPEFLDETDEAGLDLTQRSKINTTFGRQFQIVSFRWITPQEILGETTSA
ncbi:MAG: hypothetical protein JWO82_1497, partial [Akkermansiaceae bacterium]|nr:hypothetical protein [Akkermansiaceae bacterium]